MSGSKIIDLLNSSTENYYVPLIKCADMTIGKYYPMKSLSFKKTSYGKKSCIILEDEAEDRLLFLPPSWSQEAKKNLLVKLFADPSKNNFISLCEIKATTNGLNVPVFSFKQT